MWNKKCLKRLKMDGYTCQHCGETNKPLDVHHKTYERFGSERMSDLESLCRKCHKIEHGEPVYDYNICRTCGEFLLIIIRKLKIFGQNWTQFTCQDGHTRSYRDE